MIGAAMLDSGFTQQVVDLFVYIQKTELVTKFRESDYGFVIALAIHTFGLSFLLGANTIVSIRLLGIAPTIPLKPLRKLFPYMWLGLILAAISGVALGAAHASTRLLNPITGFKLLVIFVATPIMWKMQKKIFDEPNLSDATLPQNARMIAASQLVLWLTVMVVGRMIAYSATILGWAE
jgi:hypothetical protein